MSACSLLRRDPGDVTVAELLRAQLHSAGVDRNGDLNVPGLRVAAVGHDRIVVVHASRDNWKIRVAQIRALADGHVIAEKAIAVHPLGSGGADSVIAMRVRSPGEIVFAESNGEIVIWDIAADRLRYLSNRAANRVIYGMDFLRDGRLLVHDSNDSGHFEVWDIDADRLVTELPGAQAFVLNEKRNVLVARDGAFEELDAVDFRVLRRYERPDEHATGLARLPAGHILEQVYSGKIRVWDFRNAKSKSAPRLVATIAPPGDDWNLHATYHAGGYVLTSQASTHDDPTRCGVCVWSLADGSLKERIALAPEGDGVEQRIIACVPLDRHRVATIEEDGTTKIWDLRNEQMLRNYPALLKDYVES